MKKIMVLLSVCFFIFCESYGMEKTIEKTTRATTKIKEDTAFLLEKIQEMKTAESNEDIKDFYSSAERIVSKFMLCLQELAEEKPNIQLSAKIAEEVENDVIEWKTIHLILIAKHKNNKDFLSNAVPIEDLFTSLLSIAIELKNNYKRIEKLEKVVNAFDYCVIL